eukprot:TRINITY_DN6296_c0_g1_i2.p1 TRINITY_DN6296_c0_g1~~TRINITY_DN6296_c0_g1_i2.p1  ORF type:complete len:299 (+),score=87.41 TRINITY_DN6296_c0_g1_i2:73-969(+)
MRCLQALLLAAAAAVCTAADTLWCRTDSDCADHYKNGSRCTAGACVCAEEGSYPTPGVPLCARDGRTVFFMYVRVMFSRPDTCPDDVAVKTPLVNAVLRAVGASPSEFWAESGECADTYYMADVFLNVPDLAIHTHNLTDLVGRRLQQDGNAALQQAGLLQPTHVGVRWLDSLQCDVPHATEAEYRHPHCLATACEAGHVLNATHGTCELQTTDPITTGEPDTDAPHTDTMTTAPHSSDDDSLSGGAIAGIVCGAVVGVALLAAGVWLLCLRKDAPAAPQENTGDVDLQRREPHTAEV